MIIMYPLTNQLDYTELRYSLRSVEKYLPGYEVVIVGEYMPEWINNVTQITVKDFKGRKQLSIRKKIISALSYSDTMFFMNDDTFLLEKPDISKYYYHGDLKTYPEGGSRQLWSQLQAIGKPTKHFDGHYPLVYTKDFIEASSNFTDECIIKSSYCNYLEIEGTPIKDCKLTQKTDPEKIKDFIKDKPCFSTGVNSLNSSIPVLKELYPYPSKYEI